MDHFHFPPLVFFPLCGLCEIQILNAHDLQTQKYKVLLSLIKAVPGPHDMCQISDDGSFSPAFPLFHTVNNNNSQRLMRAFATGTVRSALIH